MMQDLISYLSAFLKQNETGVCYSALSTRRTYVENISLGFSDISLADSYGFDLLCFFPSNVSYGVCSIVTNK